MKLLEVVKALIDHNTDLSLELANTILNDVIGFPTEIQHQASLALGRVVVTVYFGGYALPFAFRESVGGQMHVVRMQDTVVKVDIKALVARLNRLVCNTYTNPTYLMNRKLSCTQLH